MRDLGTVSQQMSSTLMSFASNALAKKQISEEFHAKIYEQTKALNQYIITNYQPTDSTIVTRRGKIKDEARKAARKMTEIS